MRSEVWKDIPDFDGFQVSDTGHIRSYWEKARIPNRHGGTYRKRVATPYILPESDDGNGYMKVFMTSNSGKRYCKKVHKLVADAFLPLPDDHEYVDYTVDHIKPGPEGKLDNSVWNLQWLSRADNIRKAYREGMCDSRIASQSRDIVAIDMWSGEEAYFDSIAEAARELNLNHSSIAHALRNRDGRNYTNHYVFEYAGREDRLLYGDEDYKFLSWVRIGIR